MLCQFLFLDDLGRGLGHVESAGRDVKRVVTNLSAHFFDGLPSHSGSRTGGMLFLD